TLRSGSSRHARGLTTDNGRSAINRDASCVREQYTTAEWNSFRVDGAMVRAQTRTVGTCADLTFARPVNGDPSQQRIFGRENRGREQKSKANCCQYIFHTRFAGFTLEHPAIPAE